MNKSKTTRFTLNFAAFICFAVALALLILLRLFKHDSFEIWYKKVEETLLYYELWMQTYGATWISAVLILANYALKALIPWFPISCICVVSGVLFKWYHAIIINVAGIVILFTIRFFWGKKFGAGNAEKIINRYVSVKNIIGSDSLSASLILFGLRLSPLVPINSVSSLYGTTDIDFKRYLALSVVGFSYKLFSYTIIGRNVFDPASASFIVPFVLLLLFSGFVLLSLSGALSAMSQRRKKNINTF